MNIHYDQKNGMGQVPYNEIIDYRGFKCWMYPDMFLRIARKIFIDPTENYYLLMKNAIKKGKPIGSPFFSAIWDASKQVWTLSGHEGRHRMQAIKELWPNEAVEVHIIPLGETRARDITPEMLKSFMEGVVAEDHTYVQKPTAKIVIKGKEFNPQQLQQQTPQQPVTEGHRNEKGELQRFWHDPLKPGNIFIFHGTRNPVGIWQRGITPNVPGVISKASFSAVFAAEDPAMASSKTDYEEKLKQSHGQWDKKGNRFIVVASVPKKEVDIITTSSDLRIYRSITETELVAIFPDNQIWWGEHRFTRKPYFIKPEYENIIQKYFTKISDRLQEKTTKPKILKNKTSKNKIQKNKIKKNKIRKP